MNSHDLEQGIIGGILLDSSVLSEIEITPDDFMSDNHAEIYKAILLMSASGEVIDFLTVADRLQSTTGRNWVGLVGQIAGDNVASRNVKRYSELLKDMTGKRKASAIAETLIRNVSTDDGAVDQAIRDLMQINTTRKNFECSLEDASILAIEEIDRVMNSPSDISGISTGLKSIDTQMGGLHNSDLIVIGARPAMGKTAFMLNIANRSGAAVGIISGEQGRAQVAARSISMLGRVSAHKMRVAKKLDDTEFSRITTGIAAIQGKNVRIYDKPAPTIDDIVRQARKWKQNNGTEMILVDYIQRIKAPGATKREQVGYAAQTLKELARELDIPVVVLSQVNRGVESRPDRRPMNSDLKEAGDIEQEADVIAMLYRDEVYNPESQYKGIAEIIFTKNRHGPIGRINTVWLPEYMAFQDMERNYDYE